MGRAKIVTRTALILVVVALVLFGGPLVNVYVDLLWFGEVGQQRVWWTILGAQAQLAAIFGLGMALIVYLNVFLARRASPPLTPRLNDFPLRVRVGQLAQRGIAWLLIAGCAVIGALAALWAASYWETYLLFRHAQRFEVADPIFRRDVGFYVFTLPFWRLVYQWLLASLMLSTLAAIGVYVLDRAVEVMQGYMRVAVGVRGHLSALLGLIALTLAWGFYLDRYDLLFNDNGILFGANWTDVNVRRGALVLLMIAALVTAGAFFYNVYYRDLRLPAWTAAFMAVAWFTVGTLYPALQQRFVVQPNELQLERPYLQNHLAATRQAFGLDRMLVRDYPMRGQLSPAALQKEAATLTNVRLWDWRALGQAYQALQSLRGYYDLTEVDVDRYQINGRYRQVMLAARRMDTSRLPDTQWVNRRLTYTHGNGVVMSPVNEVEENGQPIFWLRNLPVQSDVKDLKITRPEIYYSDLGSPPVIALSKAAEFDYPREQAEATSHYEGRGGIPVGGLWRRLLLAIFLGDTNVAISDQIEPRSRLLLRRQIDERLAHVAPFLRFEHDPYLAIAQDGRLYYMLDAYTVTDRYPYSAPYRYFYSRLRTLMDGGLVEDAPGWFNYIRNAVKATVDAYDGTVRLYVADPTDPLIQAYQAIFPSLFHSLAEMPGDLRTHIRYPEDLLNIQARVFRAYHVTNPDTFYKNGDLWEVATEVQRPGDERDAPPLPPLRGVEPAPNPPIDPYYLIMRLPEAEGAAQGEEFVLVLPMVFKGRENMAAWLAGRSDGEHYGELVLYTFPPGSPPDSPQIVDNRIQSHPAISQAISLWQGRGSAVNYGSLQVLPVADTLIYIRPLYLRATGQATDTGNVGTSIGAFPELQQVVAVHGTRVVMRPRLPQALAELFGAPEEVTPTAPGPSAPVPVPATNREARLRQLGEQLQREMEAMNQAQRAGRWAEYGQRLDAVQRAARELNEVIRQSGGAQ